jgi:hypothetical protein
MVNKFHGYGGKDIPLSISFNERDTCMTRCMRWSACCTTSTAARSGGGGSSQRGRPQVNVVQWTGGRKKKQTYLMIMSLHSALGISPNDDNDCPLRGWAE